MLSNCITFMLKGKVAAFPFANPGPHEDTLERFRREGMFPSVERVDFAERMAEPVTMLGFKGAFLREDME